MCVYVIRLRADNGAESPSPRSGFFPEQRGAEGVIVSAEYNLCGKKHWEYPFCARSSWWAVCWYAAGFVTPFTLFCYAKCRVNLHSGPIDLFSIGYATAHPFWSIRVTVSEHCLRNSSAGAGGACSSRPPEAPSDLLHHASLIRRPTHLAVFCWREYPRMRIQNVHTSVGSLFTYRSHPNVVQLERRWREKKAGGTSILLVAFIE